MRLQDAMKRRQLAKLGYLVEDYYAAALREIRDEKTDESIWAEAFAAAKGNGERVQALYVKKRGLRLCQAACEADQVAQARQLATQRAAPRQPQRRVGSFIHCSANGGTAFCLGCRKVCSKADLLFWKERDAYCHQECLPLLPDWARQGAQE